MTMIGCSHTTARSAGEGAEKATPKHVDVRHKPTIREISEAPAPRRADEGSIACRGMSSPMPTQCRLQPMLARDERAD
jgi:hypothetical protein